MENNFSLSKETPPILIEKKEQRKVAGAVGLSLLALFAIMVGWSFVYVRIMGNIGFDYSFILKTLDNPAVNELVQIAVSTLMFIIPTFIFLRIVHEKAYRVIEFSLPQMKNKAAYIVAALGFCMFASQAGNYMANIFASFGFTFPSMDKELPTDVLGITLVVLSTSFFPALLEEFMMRGAVLGVLRRFGDGFAVIASSAVFALMHASLIQFAFAFLVGIVLGFITVKSRSIWPAVIIHAANNFISVVFSYLGLYLTVSEQNIVFFIFLLIIFATSVLAIVKISEDKEFLKLEKAKTEATEAKKIGWFLSSPWMVVAICIAFAIAIFLR